MVIQFKRLYLAFGLLNPNFSGPGKTRVYEISARITRDKLGREVVEREREFHDALCPCFRCEFKVRAKEYDRHTAKTMMEAVELSSK